MYLRKTNDVKVPLPGFKFKTSHNFMKSLVSIDVIYPFPTSNTQIGRKINFESEECEALSRKNIIFQSEECSSQEK